MFCGFARFAAFRSFGFAKTFNLLKTIEKFDEPT